MARWISGELAEGDPELQEMLVRRPELLQVYRELRQASVDLDGMAAETDDIWQGIEPSADQASIMRRAATGAGVEWPQDGADTAQVPNRPPASARSWALAAAAAVLVLFAAWQPWREAATEPRGYLSDPLAELPVGAVESFEQFLLREVPGRALVTIVVYDQNDEQLAEWTGRGPEWKPTDEQRTAMRAAGAIRWKYTVEDPVGGLRAGEAEAALGPPAGSR